MTSADRASMRTALEAYDQGKVQQAEPTLRDLAARYPKNYESNEALGSLYTETNDLPHALIYLRRASTISPKESLAHANLGALYLKMSKAPEAVQELQAAAKLDPANGATQANLGQALMLARQPKAAAQAFAAAAAISPDDADLKYNQALALYDSGSAREAGSILDALPQASFTPEMHSLAGDADEHAGEFTKALAHYEAAAKASPSDATLYAVVAELLRHWNWEEAIQIADYGATQYPSNEHFRMASGIAHYAKSDYPSAIVTFSSLLQADPNNALAADLLGRSCAALADGENTGCAVVADFAQRHPGNAVMTTYAAVAILHAPEHEQNLDKAAALLKTAIADDPKYAEAYLRMGVLEQMRLHWAESAPYLEQSIALNPTAPEPHYRLSRAYAHMGRSEDAQAQIALHKTYSQQAKDSLDARLQEVMRFVLNPG
ncbi:TPR repeat [Granulicella sibirica]|uniref:TPR repeat n=2 Tax=Granulicella sibirica TaxID=2479048 RepID=A0A4Q0SWR2_9BACT|nr:TPR repeat [Granulicella sibirica]